LFSLGLLALSVAGGGCDEISNEDEEILHGSALDTLEDEEAELILEEGDDERGEVARGELIAWQPEMTPQGDSSLEGPGELTTDNAMMQVSCTKDNDCRASCGCNEGLCVPVPPGPMPPASHCALPPTRSCDSASDCRSGCSCAKGSCREPMVSPLPPQPIGCHLPPPDIYEPDDSWPQYSSYTGPQVHNFHTPADRDWTAVYIANKGKVRFQTKDLTHGTDTRIKVFAYDGVSKGDLLGAHDDLGGWYLDPDSKSSRVDLKVGPNSMFLIKVINKSAPHIYDGHTLPTYTLHLSYI